MTQPDSSPETAAASQVLAGAPSGGARGWKLSPADARAFLPPLHPIRLHHPLAPRAVPGRGVVVFAPGRRGRAAHQP